MKARLKTASMRQMLKTKSNQMQADISIAEKKLTELNALDEKTNVIYLTIDKLSRAIDSAMKKKKWFDDRVHALSYMNDDDVVFLYDEEILRFA